jgi:hypothetical protein
MRHLLNVFPFLFIAFGLYSCTSSKKLIEKQQTEFGNLKFYVDYVSRGKSEINKVYADTDSNGVKRFYSFYPDRIVMTDERVKNLSYTVSYHQLPDNLDSTIFQRLSPWDTLVFSKALTILKANKYLDLKNPQGASGYEIVINYYHGFPNKKKFKPL